MASASSERGGDRLAFVAEASRVLGRASDVPGILRELAHLLVPALGDFAGIALLQPDGALGRVETLAADPAVQPLVDELHRKFPPSTRPGSLYHTVLTSNRPVLVPELSPEALRASAQGAEHLELIGRLGLRAACIVPIAHEDVPVGVLAVAITRASGRTLGPDDQSMLVDLAQRLAAALVTAQALERERALREKLKLLAEAGAALSKRRDQEGVVEGVLSLSRQLIAADAFAVWLQTDGRWRVVASSGLSDGYVREIEGAMDHSGPLPSSAFRLGHGVSPPISEPHAAAREREGIRESLVFPLRLRDRPDGTLAFYFKREHKPTEQDIHLGETLAALAATAIVNAQAYEALAQSEAQLRESEARSRGIYESLADSVLLIRDPDGLIERANRATLAMFGYEESELLGQPTRILHVDDAHHEDFGRLCTPGFREGGYASFRFRMRRKDGVVFPTEHSVHLLRDAGGHELGVVSVIRDISQRVAADSALRESEARFRALFEQASVGIAVFEAATGALTVNAAVARMLGYTQEEIVSRGWEALTHPDDVERERGYLADLLAGRAQSLTFEKRYLHREGRILWAQLTVSTVADPNGALRYALILIQDVTARRQAEEALRARDAELRSLIEQSPYSIQTYGLDGHITSVNPAWGRLFGVTIEHVRDYNIRRDPQLAAAGIAPLVERAFGGEAVALPLIPWTPDRGEREGRPLWLRAVLYPVKDGEGRVRQVAMMHEDTTAQVEAQRELDAVRAQLLQSEKLAALGSLVGGVAHELRTPLTYLANNLHLFERQARRLMESNDPATRARTAATLDQTLAAAHDAIARIDRIVEDLRRFTRLKSDGFVQEPLEPSLREAIDLFRATQRGHVAVELDLQSAGLVRLDRVQLQQVLLNLLTNAAEARPRDARVRVRTRDEGGVVALEVEDRGAGMSPETLERIWDPFFTTKPEGTGLGLSIVRRIVEAHGGSIVARSAPGEGTTFRVELPLAR